MIFHYKYNQLDFCKEYKEFVVNEQEYKCYLHISRHNMIGRYEEPYVVQARQKYDDPYEIGIVVNNEWYFEKYTIPCEEKLLIFICDKMNMPNDIIQWDRIMRRKKNIKYTFLNDCDPDRALNVSIKAIYGPNYQVEYVNQHKAKVLCQRKITKITKQVKVLPFTQLICNNIANFMTPRWCHKLQSHFGFHFKWF